MKIKKTSLVALIVAVALIAGVITVFATSAEANEKTASIPTATPISTNSPQAPTAKPDTSTEIPSNDIGVSSDYISAPCSKDGVEELMSIIGEIELGGLSAGMITDKEHCYNVTPLSVAAETDIKIFKFSDSCLSLALIDNEVYEICTSFGGYGFVNAVPWDYDEDGNLDLLIASSWGSGLHRSEISVFNTKTKESIVIYVAYDNPFTDLFVAAVSPSFSSEDINDVP